MIWLLRVYTYHPGRNYLYGLCVSVLHFTRPDWSSSVIAGLGGPSMLKMFFFLFIPMTRVVGLGSAELVTTLKGAIFEKLCYFVKKISTGLDRDEVGYPHAQLPGQNAYCPLSGIYLSSPMQSNMRNASTAINCWSHARH